MTKQYRKEEWRPWRGQRFFTRWEWGGEPRINTCLPVYIPLNDEACEITRSEELWSVGIYGQKRGVTGLGMEELSIHHQQQRLYKKRLFREELWSFLITFSGRVLFCSALLLRKLYSLSFRDEELNNKAQSGATHLLIPSPVQAFTFSILAESWHDHGWGEWTGFTKNVCFERNQLNGGGFLWIKELLFEFEFF